MVPLHRRFLAAVLAAALTAAALGAALALGPEEREGEVQPAPPDAAFLRQTGLAVRFVKEHGPAPVSNLEAAEIGGRGAPAEAWLAIVEPAGDGSAALPGLVRLADYVEKARPLWFVVIDEEPDLSGPDGEALALPWDDAGLDGWFNIAFVDPYSGAYVLGMAGVLEDDDEGKGMEEPAGDSGDSGGP